MAIIESKQRLAVDRELEIKFRSLFLRDPSRLLGLLRSGRLLGQDVLDERLATAAVAVRVTANEQVGLDEAHVATARQKQ